MDSGLLEAISAVGLVSGILLRFSSLFVYNYKSHINYDGYFILCSLCNRMIVDSYIIYIIFALITGFGW